MLHTDMDVYKSSILLTIEIYLITSHLPKDEMFGFTSKLRRATVSIPSNIAEGAGRKSSKELCLFMDRELGSLSVMDTQVETVQMLTYITEDTKPFSELLTEVGQLRLRCKKNKLTTQSLYLTLN